MQHFDLGVAQLFHGSLELLLSHVRLLLDLSAGEVVAPVEHTQDRSLESIDYKGILLTLRVSSLQLDLAVRVHPGQLPVLIFGLEPLLEAIHAAFHLWRDLAGRLVHRRPGSTG